MLVGGDVIAVKNKNYLFCGFRRTQTEFNIDMVTHNDYFNLSTYIEEIKEDAINNILYNTAVFYTVNDELELDENSKLDIYLYVNLFDDSIRVKHIDNIEDYLGIWRTKLKMLNKENNPIIPELIDIDKALTLLETKRKQIEKESFLIFKNFLMDLLVMYENTEYYERIKDFMIYHVKETRRCITNLNVFQDGNKFLFLSKGSVVSLFASVDISDIKGCVLALAKRGKDFHEWETLEKVLGE